MKNNKKIVLKVNMKKLTLIMAEIIKSKCDLSHISNFKRIHTHYTVDQHQKPTKNPPRCILSNLLAKKN